MHFMETKQLLLSFRPPEMDQKVMIFIVGSFNSEITYHFASTKRQKKVHLVEAKRSKMGLNNLRFVEAKCLVIS